MFRNIFIGIALLVCSPAVFAENQVDPVFELLKKRFEKIEPEFAKGLEAGSKAEALMKLTTISSLPELLSRLQESDPNILKNKVAGIYTRSIHRADPKHPRMLLPSDDGKTLFALSTDPEDPFYNRLEIIEVDLESLKKNPRGQAYRVFEAEEQKGKPLHWREATQDCVTCHSTRPMVVNTMAPKWNGYPLWERFLGGLRDTDDKTNAYSKSIVKDLNDYAKANPNSRIALFAPYDDDESAVTQFSVSLHAWNMFRLARAILSHRDFPKYEKAISFALFLGNSDYKNEYTSREDLVAEAFGEKGSPLYNEYLRRFHQLKSEYRPAIRRMYESYVDAQGAISNSEMRKYWQNWEVQHTDHKTGEQKNIKRLDLFSEDYAQDAAIIGAAVSFVDIDLRDWSLQMARGVPYFGGLTQFQLRTLIPLLTDDKLPDDKIPDTDKTFLPELQKWTQASRDLLKTIRPNAMAPQVEFPAPYLLKTDCANCHRQDNSLKAPVYPFGESDAFNQSLTPNTAKEILKTFSKKEGSRRMPLFHPEWSPEEIQRLRNYMDERLILKKLEQPEQKNCP